jgi:hypothetical protein
MLRLGPWHQSTIVARARVPVSRERQKRESDRESRSLVYSLNQLLLIAVVEIQRPQAEGE